MPAQVYVDCTVYTAHVVALLCCYWLLFVTCVYHVSVLCDEVLIVERIHLFLHSYMYDIMWECAFVPSTSENRDCYTFCLFVCLCKRGWFCVTQVNIFNSSPDSCTRYVDFTCTQDIGVRVWCVCGMYVRVCRRYDLRSRFHLRSSRF